MQREYAWLQNCCNSSLQGIFYPDIRNCQGQARPKQSKHIKTLKCFGAAPVFTLIRNLKSLVRFSSKTLIPSRGEESSEAGEAAAERISQLEQEIPEIVQKGRDASKWMNDLNQTEKRLQIATTTMMVGMWENIPKTSKI